MHLNLKLVDGECIFGPKFLRSFHTILLIPYMTYIRESRVRLYTYDGTPYIYILFSSILCYFYHHWYFWQSFSKTPDLQYYPYLRKFALLMVIEFLLLAFSLHDLGSQIRGGGKSTSAGNKRGVTTPSLKPFHRLLETFFEIHHSCW